MSRWVKGSSEYVNLGNVHYAELLGDDSGRVRFYFSSSSSDYKMLDFGADDTAALVVLDRLLLPVTAADLS